MKYYYQARTKDGTLETGTIEAYSQDAALELLHKYNVFITLIRQEKSRESFLRRIKFTGKISKKELALFFRQLSIMLESQVPVVQSLTSLAEQMHRASFKETLRKIAGMIEEGLPLSEALAAHPKVFSAFYVNLIKSGEASGKVSRALHRVSEHLEQESDISAQVRQAMIYPIFVISFMIISIAIIVLFLVPKIAQLISETGVEPAPFTTAMINFYAFMAQYWWLGAGVLAVVVSVTAYYAHTPRGRAHRDFLSLKIPFIGDLMKKVFLVRFASNISTLLIAGVSINKALVITESTVNNSVYQKIVTEIGEKVSEGEKMSAVMAVHRDYFPPFVAQMVKIGEDTGKLDQVLTEVVTFYQKEIKRTIDIFAALLEPIIITVLGITITLLAISVLSSLYGVIGTL